MECYSCRKEIKKAHYFAGEAMCKACQKDLRKDSDHGFMKFVFYFITALAIAYFIGIIFVFTA